MDRNLIMIGGFGVGSWSLSARRAWIEIASDSLADTSEVVALRKESVDRNYKNLPKQSIHHKSLSARRAWIEIKA